MSDWLAAGFTTTGAVFILLAGIGVLRLPDVYSRMSATTKSATLGVGCVMIGAAIHFDDVQVTLRSAAVIAFLFLTAPVGAHMIGRAAFLTGVPLWEPTVCDELSAQWRAERGVPARDLADSISGETRDARG